MPKPQLPGATAPGATAPRGHNLKVTAMQKATTATKPTKPATKAQAVLAATVPVAPAPVATVAISPVVAPAGKSTKGSHIVAWRTCLKAGGLPTTATCALVNPQVNPWHAGTAGAALFALMAQHKPATVQATIALAQQHLSYKPNATMGHLVWLYTWGGGLLLVNGKLYNQA
jgi:hypothetical protein